MKYIYSIVFVLLLNLSAFAMAGGPPIELTPNNTNEASVTHKLYGKNSDFDLYAPMFYGEVTYQTLGNKIKKLNEKKKTEYMDDGEYTTLLDQLKKDDNDYVTFYTDLTYYSSIKNVGKELVNLDNVKVMLFANDDMTIKSTPESILKTDVIESITTGKYSNTVTYHARPIVKFSRANLPQKTDKLTIMFIISGSINQQVVDFKKDDTKDFSVPNP